MENNGRKSLKFFAEKPYIFFAIYFELMLNGRK